MAGESLFAHLPAGWELRRLDEVSTIIDCLHKTPIYSSAGFPMVRVTDVKGGFLNLHNTLRVTKDIYEDFTRREKPRCGDIVFSRVGTYGNSSFVNNDVSFCLGQNTALVRPTVNSRYLYYCLQSPSAKQQIEQAAVGSTQKTISLKSISAIRVSVPSNQEVERIAHILGTLDDKIELNRRMNETLEAMARAIFKSWFVDFDPVRAKAAGRNPGLPKPLANLFPASFEDSELGEIPKGWKMGTLAQCADLNSEAWTKNTAPNEIVYVDLSNTKWGKIEMTQRFPRKDAPSRAQRVLRIGDTIVGTVRPGNGSYSLVAEEGLTGSTGFAVLRPRKPTLKAYVFLVATASDNIDRLSHLADGGAYPAVRPEVVLATDAVQPTEDVMAAFSMSVEPLLNKISTNDCESRTLAALRDALLPKLLSGEIRVADADRIVGRAI